MSLGILNEEPQGIVDVLQRARSLGIIVLASASNEGANHTISFPATLDTVFCIGSADGKGSRSSFSPPFVGKEKYSALGEGVRGALPLGKDPSGNLYIRKSGTSTATVVAAGISALLIDFTAQYLDKVKPEDNPINLRKIFLKMSEATEGEPYRFLSPKYLCTLSKDTARLIKTVVRNPARISLYFFVIC